MTGADLHQKQVLFKASPSIPSFNDPGNQLKLQNSIQNFVAEQKEYIGLPLNSCRALAAQHLVPHFLYSGCVHMRCFAAH